jgi:hypothetical protein
VPNPERLSHEQQAAQIAGLTARVTELLAVVAEQAALIETLRAEVAALCRQAGRDSSSSSQPPSQEGPAAEAKAKARAGGRRARPGRSQGGQKGHPGSGRAWAARPDETRVLEPGTCGGCGAGLAGAQGRVASSVQVLDIPPAALTVTEYQMMCRTCGCGQVLDHRVRDPGWLPRVLVRDDYGGYLSYDAGPAGVQQCLAHLYRYLDDTCATDPESQVWTRQVGDALRAAAARTARDARQASLEPALLARLRHSYDQAVTFGISVNLSRPWHKGSHPGLILARRLKRKAAQVWLFATRFDVPATSNGSENAIRGCKLAAKISGCWRTLAALQRHCRIRSCLTTARSHGRHPLAAIRDALTGTPWMPPQPA